MSTITNDNYIFLATLINPDAMGCLKLTFTFTGSAPTTLPISIFIVMVDIKRPITIHEQKFAII